MHKLFVMALATCIAFRAKEIIHCPALVQPRLEQLQYGHESYWLGSKRDNLQHMSGLKRCNVFSQTASSSKSEQYNYCIGVLWFVCWTRIAGVHLRVGGFGSSQGGSFVGTLFLVVFLFEPVELR
jgi:hypothetical protein